MRKFPTTREQAAYEAGLADAAKRDQEPLTLDAIKQMSQAEVVERKPEVDAVLAGGQS
jgi:hypothetical protein